MKDYGGPFSFCIWFFLSKNFYFVLMVWVCKKNRSIEKKTIKKKHLLTGKLGAVQYEK